MASPAASVRLEFRLRPDVKRKIERAAELAQVSASDFARTAVEERADEVLRSHETVTVVPADFLDALLAALDDPPQVNEPLARGARRARDVVKTLH